MKPLLFGAAALLVIGGAIFFLSRGTGPVDPAVAPAVDAPAPVKTTDPAGTESPPARPTPDADKPAPSAPATPRPVTPPKPTGASLVLESDVPGASVFLDRKYVGTTPLRLDALEPGQAQLKFTAEGYEGIDRTVDLEAGENAVAIRFREVRLNERIPVVHRHGIGSCEGTLVATVDGLAYNTTNANDAFKLPFAQLETFAVDYLEKNLRVKQAGGRTWNFTDPKADSADALFVFHREVEAARKKLAEGYTPVRSK